MRWTTASTVGNVSPVAALNVSIFQTSTGSWLLSARKSSRCIMEKTTTSVPSWQSSLNLLLKQAANKADRPPRIVIMGIGNEMRADDAAGMLVARRLLEHECIRENERVRVILAEHAPENATWQLRGFAP